MAEKAWRVLRDDYPEVELDVCDLPEGVSAIYVTDGEDSAVLINRRMSPVDRLAALVHEIAHHRRGGGCHVPDASPLLQSLARKEEARVDVLVADEMLPPAKLLAYVEQRAEIDGMVLARDVAEDLEVPVDVADLALRRLAAGF